MRLWPVAAVFLLGGVATSSAQWPAKPMPPRQASRLLSQLLERKQYFALEQWLQGPVELSGLDRAFFEGVLANRRNHVALSIARLQPLIAALAARNKDHAVIALSTLADDYEKSFQYSAAADTYQELQQHYATYMTAAERLRVGEEAKRWNLLRGAPPQRVHVTTPFIVPARRDSMGLLEVSVDLGGHPRWMILDTGANISTLTSTLARQLGLKLTTASATTKGIIGETITIHGALIPRLRLGRATLRNVPVIVVPDKAMFVRSLGFKIPPSLGFPVLQALGRITFFSDGRFGVQLPAPRAFAPSRPNLFLERLTPLVAAQVGRQEQLFTFDTGSSGIFLSAQYYRRHVIAFQGRTLTRFRLAGAGGSRQFPAYMLSRLRMRLGGGCTLLSNVPVLAAARGISDDYFWGNLGQAAVRRFRSYTLDFRRMSFEVDPPARVWSPNCP